MPKRLQREIEKLKKHILALGAEVEESLYLAVRSIELRDYEMAKKVIENDLDIDQMEVDLEEECLKVLVLHQPVAIDLRFIIAILKINNDMERIGDLTVNMSQWSRYLDPTEKLEFPPEISSMAEKTQAMLRRSLDALVNMNSSIAYEVCAADDEVDDLNHAMYKMVEDKMRDSTENLKGLIQILMISRSLERIADHATNIAEDVIYLVDGDIIRHGREGCTPPSQKSDTEPEDE